jgi:hypothetical protein
MLTFFKRMFTCSKCEKTRRRNKRNTRKRNTGKRLKGG